GSGRADRREQGRRVPGRPVQRAVHGEGVARAQRRQCAGHRGARGGPHARQGDPAAVARDAVPGRATHSPARADRGHRARGNVMGDDHATDYAASWDALKKSDPEVAGALADELNRERTTIRLVASENYTSPAVLAALASTMNNKYAEGYPGRRYYGGCGFVDGSGRLALVR